MIDPQTALKGIYQVTKLIYDQVQLVKANQKQCKRLAERIKIIEETVHGLDALEDKSQYQKGLNELLKALNLSLEVIQKFTTSSRWYRWLLKTGTYKDTFNGLNEALQKAMLMLNLGLTAQQVVNREQDKADQAADHQFICQQEKEIINLNQAANQALQQLSLAQEDRQEVLMRQLASIKEQFKILTVASPAQPLIDPQYQISYYELIFDRKLVDGSFGKIYAGRWSEQTVVIKALEGGFTQDEEKRFVREVGIMSQLRHPQITQFYGACIESGRACLVMEYMEKGSLVEVLKTSLTAWQQHQLALDIAKGLAYLHSRQVWHRDLKSSNVLVNAEGKAKLSDFSLSKTQAIHIQTAQKGKQTLEWMPPEYLERGEYTAQSDIYSYGIILWEIMAGQRPYATLARDQIAPAVLKNYREPIPATVPAFYQQLIQQCWQQDPTQRPSPNEVIRQLEAYTPQQQIDAPPAEAEANYQQGIEQERQKNYQQAFTHYEKAALQGHMRAKTNLGTLYLKGIKNVIAQDKVKAHRWFKEAAQQGHSRAMLSLAMMLEYGDGIPQDVQQAMQWYKQAADQGDSNAKARYEKLASVFAPAPNYPSMLETLSQPLSPLLPPIQSPPSSPAIIVPTNSSAIQSSGLISFNTLPRERLEPHAIIGNKYALLNHINQQEAQALLEQTGLNVTFLPGERKTKFTLGKGNFGKLRLAQDITNGQFVGVKKIKGEAKILESKQEARLQRSLNDIPHLMPLLDSVEIKGSKGERVLYQFMPLAGFGNGEEFAKQAVKLPDETLRSKLLIKAARGILEGVQGMHQASVYHFDLKPSNVVFDQQGYAYIIDFGCACKLLNGSEVKEYKLSDMRYFAPERMAHLRQFVAREQGMILSENDPAFHEQVAQFDAAKVEAWAVGLLLLELAGVMYPFTVGDLNYRLAVWGSRYFQENLDQIEELKNPAPDSYWAIVKGLLTVTPHDRLGIKEALDRPIFKQLENQFASDEACSQSFAMLRNQNTGNESVQLEEESQAVINFLGKLSVSNYQEKYYLQTPAHVLEKAVGRYIDVEHPTSAAEAAQAEQPSPLTRELSHTKHSRSLVMGGSLKLEKPLKENEELSQQFDIIKQYVMEGLVQKKWKDIVLGSSEKIEKPNGKSQAVEALGQCLRTIDRDIEAGNLTTRAAILERLIPPLHNVLKTLETQQSRTFFGKRSATKSKEAEGMADAIKKLEAMNVPAKQYSYV